MIMISSNFIFNFTNFCVITTLLTLGILFSTAVTAVVVAKLVMLFISPLTSFILALREALVAELVIIGISPLTSFILALREALVAKLVVLGISPLTSFTLTLREALVVKLVISGNLSSIFLILALYKSFFKTSFFTTSFSLIKSTGTNLSTSTF